MKRLILFLVVTFLFIPCFLFADEPLPGEDTVIDEFDLLFEDAGEDIVVEEAEVPTLDNVNESSPVSGAEGQATVIIREAASAIKFSGSFSSNIGVAATYNNGTFGAGGALTLSNSFYMTAKPATDFTLHATVSTTESSVTLNLSSFYFDYLWKSVFISAGKKSLTWGNIRLFNTGTYDTVYTNVLSGFGPLVAQVQVPFLGNWTFVGGAAATLNWDQMKYAVSYNNVLGNTNIDLYGTYATGSIAAGLELKRTIAGFDFYAQAIGRLEGGFKKAYGTAGFYRLWETDGPDYGINAEYQFIHDRTGSVPEYHKIAVETGVKQLGKKKNFKIGTQWGHNITDGTGLVNVAFLLGGIFPHANWTNAISVNYGSGFSNPNVTLGSTISLSIDY